MDELLITTIVIVTAIVFYILGLFSFYGIQKTSLKMFNTQQQELNPPKK